MNPCPIFTLLPTLKLVHPEGVSTFGTRQRMMVFELFDVDNRPDPFIQYLGDHFRCEEERIGVIDLIGIDLFGPSAASACVEGINQYFQRHRRPMLLINVQPEALEALQTCRYVRLHHPTLLALDPHLQWHLIGSLADRLIEVFRLLDDKQDGASASDLAEQPPHDTTKRDINRYSVYLQELHGLGLVMRRKVGGTARLDAERGWTYVYQPIYRALAA